MSTEISVKYYQIRISIISQNVIATVQIYRWKPEAYNIQIYRELEYIIM